MKNKLRSRGKEDQKIVSLAHTYRATILFQFLKINGHGNLLSIIKF